MLKPLPITSEGHDFELQSKVLGMYDKGSSGTVVKSEDALVDAGTGEVYARIIGSMFYVGQGNWGGPRGDKEPDVPRPGSRPDDAIEFEVPKNAAHLYRYEQHRHPTSIQLLTDSFIVLMVTIIHCMQRQKLAKKWDSAASSRMAFIPTIASRNI
ncbi:hypothetical protein FDECE_17246 [Fusarium decemcellulare]|nr:hypothetical protein FDECE_17246 [Fusarium decemcellulare]